MKIKVLSSALFLVACAMGVHAAHGWHSWSKVSQQDGLNGQVVCQWKCSYTYGEEHFTTTSGYGYCPNP